MDTTYNTYYTPSVNIVRDQSYEINYIPTNNASRVFEAIQRGFINGIRAFNIVGAYGTGKSSFLWAFEKHLNKKESFFSTEEKLLEKADSYSFKLVIGEYSSIIDSFATSFGEKKSEPTNIIQKIDEYYESLTEKKQGLVIVIDEFGKFLEFAAKNNPEKELYFVQQLAEYINDNSKNVLLVTTLHQDFNSYSYSLTNSQRLEWDKVKGRLKELAFNEPVEHLLHIASERLSKEDRLKAPNSNFDRLITVIKNSRIFPLKTQPDIELLNKLNPLELLSASILALALQRYGQNERSLFSFIEANDEYGVLNYDRESNPLFNTACVYDYLSNNYYSFLNTKYNPDYIAWASIRNAIERIENEFNEDINDSKKIVKTIGLMNIFGNASSIIDKNLITEYSGTSLGVPNASEILAKLEKNKIIRFIKYRRCFVLFEGSDVDIEGEIEKAGESIDEPKNIVKYLISIFDFTYILAKKAYYEKGVPRYFEFILSDEPIKNKKPEGQIDGYINLVFSDTLTDKEIKSHSAECNEAVLYCLFKNSKEIREIVFEIEKIKYAKNEHKNDSIALKEFNTIQSHYTILLNEIVSKNLFTSNNDNNRGWFFNGLPQVITSYKQLNRVLTEIVDKVYPSVPIFNSELINKTKLSSTISTARGKLFSKLIDRIEEADLGFEDNAFPPEKAIYLSLLKQTGIHSEHYGKYYLRSPQRESSFTELWDICEDFLNKSKHGKRNLNELIELLSSKPIKLKQGFIDFWLPIFLLAKKNDYALYDDEIYVVEITKETLELIVKKPGNFDVKAFNLSKSRKRIFEIYRDFLNQLPEDIITSSSFIETIKPFLGFYRGLVDYARTTKNISKNAIALRAAIKTATDPEKTFFEEFPYALGYNTEDFEKNPALIEEYAISLKESLREISASFEMLINRIEKYICAEFIGEQITFPDYRDILQKKYKKIKKHSLNSSLKVFYQRLFSQLDDRRSWINSIAQACIGKPLERITDEDEMKIYDKLKEIFRELNNLSDISKANIDFEREEVIKVEITSFVEGLNKNLIRLPKNKMDRIPILAKEIRAKLGDDKDLNIALLINLLKEQLNGKES